MILGRDILTYIGFNLKITKNNIEGSVGPFQRCT